MIRKLAAKVRKPLLHPKFRYKYVINPKSYYKKIFSFKFIEKERMMLHAMHLTSKLDGDYLEFGVFEGKSFIPAYYFGSALKPEMKFYAFDSFEGLPEITGKDKGSKQFNKGKFYCDLPKFKKNLTKAGVDMKKVTCVKGFYDKVLDKQLKAKLKIKKAAVIWVDCDLYESTVPVLDWVTDYVQDGTLIIFDDWHSFNSSPDKGEQKAFSEWLSKNKNITATPYQQYGVMGISFVLRKK